MKNLKFKIYNLKFKMSRSDAGFTLVEIVISIGVLMIVIMPLMLALVSSDAGSLGGALSVGKASRVLNQCAFLAERTMDDHTSRLASDFTLIPSATGGPFTYSGFDDGVYCWSTTIRELVTYGGITSRLKVVRVLTWKEDNATTCTSASGNEMRYELNSKICARGETW